MAVTFARNFSVMGDRRVVFGLVTVSTTTSGAVESGLSIIHGGGFTYHSATSAVPNAVVQFNVASGGSESNGMINIATCTAGDDFYIYAIGE